VAAESKTTTNSVPLPKPKPRVTGEHFVVFSIGSRDVALAGQSGIRQGENALEPLNFGNLLFGVHPLQSSSRTRHAVKRKGWLRGTRVQAAVCQQDAESIRNGMSFVASMRASISSSEPGRRLGTLY